MSKEDKKITRRDFLNGIGVTITGLMLSASPARVFGFAFEPGFNTGREYYPPLLTGLRGSHDGSWEAAHKLAESKDPGVFGVPEDVDGLYDLIVVGGGISGLSAAHLYRKKYGPDVKILILDNHDDFGGHATRVEFNHNGQTWMGFGGTQFIEGPSLFSSESHALLRDIGIDLNRFNSTTDRTLFDNLGLSRGNFFDREHFGRDVLLRQGSLSWNEYASLLPMSEAARKDLVRLFTDRSSNYLPGQSAIMKQRTLERISYHEYLKEYVKVHDEVLTYMQKMTHDTFGIGIDGIPAIRCFRLGRPGFGGLGLNRGNYNSIGGAAAVTNTDPNIYHFPDGCASVSRLLVRSLIPGVAPGNTMEDVVMARFNYSRLDTEQTNIRLRLNSTVITVEQAEGSASSGGTTDGVTVTYVKNDKPYRVRGKHTILACWNHVIPFICPGLPPEQKIALSYSEKLPVVYAKALIRNWQPFYKLGVDRIYCPGSYFVNVQLARPVNMEGYAFPSDPDQPMVVHFSRFPVSPGMPPRGQFRMGKYELLTTPFETFEHNIKDQLARMFGPAGFDATRDIEAITVNRWPHGYTYEYAYLGEPDWKDEEKPCNVGRKPFGRITIANSDAGGKAYLNVAIDQAHRAVEELAL
jgi:spermidine dehydrogenase